MLGIVLSAVLLYAISAGIAPEQTRFNRNRLLGIVIVVLAFEFALLSLATNLSMRIMAIVATTIVLAIAMSTLMRIDAKRAATIAATYVCTRVAVGLVWSAATSA